MILKASLLTFFAGSIIFLIVLWSRPAYVGIRSGFADENYIQSKNCMACHRDHYASWARTFHSRMTQEARPQSVQGDFERDNTFEYLSVKARMERRGDNYSMTFNFADGRTQTVSVDRTVGSRRIEQYLTKQNGGYSRLPLAYDLTNRRWMSLNGSFFHPDSEDFFQHQAEWDSNCVFCHNVKAQPHRNMQTEGYGTEVAELGIACGACHGAAASHAEKANSPFTRTLWQFAKSEAKEIVNPLKLTGERSMQVCGHCHGQRVPAQIERIQEILTRGDPYDAGEDLAQIYKPVERHTRIGNYSFANRFWANGSPRLTAYEYQGILRSRCYTAGRADIKINCLTCHTMHSGDVNGQITAENRANKPCLQCHEQYGKSDGLALHTGHQADSEGSRCYNCHMPRVVYGVMTIHPTHDITIPNPGLTTAQAVPNACNQCHLDKSVNWAIAESKRLWAERFAALEISKDKQFDLPEGARALFAGDALTRALMAEALGRDGGAQLDWRWRAPFLVEALADNYPIVRFFAANGLAKMNEQFMKNSQLAKPDYLSSKVALQNSLNHWRNALDLINPQAKAGALNLAQILRTSRQEVDLEVGE